MNVLVIDIGGTHVKILATGQKEHREFVSGPKLTAAMMVAGVRNLAKDWNYDAVSIGYPDRFVTTGRSRNPTTWARDGSRLTIDPLSSGR